MNICTKVERTGTLIILNKPKINLNNLCFRKCTAINILQSLKFEAMFRIRSWIRIRRICMVLGLLVLDPDP
jgi:hypothetical protein